MLRRFSLDELRRAGVVILPAEAVAIAQQLINDGRTGESAGEPPSGPPTPANVLLGGDGSVECAGCDATWAVPEIAAFLQTLLPPGTPGVAGGLRYTIARALLEVDAPPFDSLDEFSRALGRHEQGSRTDVIRGLLARVGSPRQADRRRSDPAVAVLRRQLREADERVYSQQRALDTLAAMVPSAPPFPRRILLAAVVALALAGAAEFIHLTRSAEAPAPATAAVATALPAESPADPAPAQPGTEIVSVAQGEAAGTSAADQPHMHPDTHAVGKPRSRAEAPARKRPARRSAFHWLRTKIAFRADPL